MPLSIKLPVRVNIEPPDNVSPPCELIVRSFIVLEPESVGFVRVSGIVTLHVAIGTSALDQLPAAFQSPETLPVQLTFRLTIFAAVFGMVFARTNVLMSSVFMIIFAVLSGILLQGAAEHVSPEIVKTAAIGTSAIFLVMTLLTFSGLDLTPFAGAMFIALIALVIGYFVTSLVGTQLQGLHRILVIAGLVLFAGFVSLDTTRILSRDYGNNFVQAAFEIYLDTVNIFSSLMDIGGD